MTSSLSEVVQDAGMKMHKRHSKNGRQPHTDRRARRVRTSTLFFMDVLVRVELSRSKSISVAITPTNISHARVEANSGLFSKHTTYSPQHQVASTNISVEAYDL